MTSRKLIGLSALSFVLCAASATIGLANTTAPDRVAYSLIGAATVAVLLGVGIYAWQRSEDGRYGQVLFVTGLCWFGVTLSNSDIGLLYSVGRASVWVFEVLLIYALLTYPTGRPEARPERIATTAAAVLVAILYLPTIPLVDQYPLPIPFIGCTTSCPSNAFFLGAEPAVIDSLIVPLRDAIAVVLYISVMVILARRLMTASHNLRWTLAPVLGAAVLRYAAAGVYVALRQTDAPASGLDVASLVALLAIPTTAIGFLIGLVQWRLYSGTALSTLTTRMAGARDPAELEGLLAESLEEPTIELYLARPGPDGARGESWVDAGGETRPEPLEASDRCVALAEAESGLRVAVVCERGFRDYPEFLDAVCSCVISALERQRLDVALAASLADVAASRKRLASTADESRQRIERDLHDGAQQQLVALRVKLELAREALERDPVGAAGMVAGLGPAVDEIIEEVRSLARGIYPPLLASDGLAEALRAAGRRSPQPVEVSAADIGRFPPETESAVYFCCLEALQNAAKHAKGTSRVEVRLRHESDLLFEVRDDGCGFAVDGTGEGSGITGMRDRLAAIDGGLRIESSPGGGTRVIGRVSLADSS